MYSQQQASGVKHGILSLTIKGQAALHAAYMPFVENGGLFIPTGKTYELGDEVFMLLNLPDEDEKLPVKGHVIWITPPSSQSGRVPGIGIQFTDHEKAARPKIEDCLIGLQDSSARTHTL
jgi:type IV pilus assembly protein PilZ